MFSNFIHTPHTKKLMQNLYLVFAVFVCLTIFVYVCMRVCGDMCECMWGVREEGVDK